VAPPTSGLSIGLDEENPNLIWSAAARPDPGGGFAPWRDRLAALRPAFYRLRIAWAAVQPRPGAPPDWTAPQSGCLRALPPCGTFAGVRDQLAAVASQQQAQGGFEVLVVIGDTPAWAAEAPHGCPIGSADPGGLAPSAAGLAGYQDLVRSLLALSRSLGVRLDFWSPWNEPNQPGSLRPQRAACAAGAPALAPGTYARIVEALRSALAGDPDRPQIVLGDAAGYDHPRATALSAPELIADLPRDVVCSAPVWAQHAYVGRPGGGASTAGLAGDPAQAGSLGLLGAVQRALDAHNCPQRHSIWITETGVGGPAAGWPRPSDPSTLAAGCRAMAAALDAWYRDTRVTAVFQYTFREDNLFPVGLADPGLTRTYPTYDLWRAWAGGRIPVGPPPALPASCR
jgi:hypothetical protein